MTMKSVITTFAVCAVASLAGAGDIRPYPLTTCVISGERLGSMGEPYVFVLDGQQIKLCCKHCKPDLDKDPAKYLQTIQKAAQSAP